MYKELRLTIDKVNTLSDAMMLLVQNLECNEKIQKPFKGLTKIDEKTRDKFRKMGNTLGRPSNNEFPVNITLDLLINIAHPL